MNQDEMKPLTEWTKEEMRPFSDKAVAELANLGFSPDEAKAVIDVALANRDEFRKKCLLELHGKGINTTERESDFTRYFAGILTVLGRLQDAQLTKLK